MRLCRQYPKCPITLRWLCLICVMLLVGSIAVPAVEAQPDLRVGVKLTPDLAEVGEVLTLMIEVQGAQDVEAPALEELDGFESTYVGPTQQMSIVNNQVSASIKHRYVLRSLKAGRFTLGPFSVKYQGHQYQTGTVQVEVMPSGQKARQLQPSNPRTQHLTNRPGQFGQLDPNGQAYWLELRTPRQEVYLHERIPLEVVLYVSGPYLADAQYPSLPGDGISIEEFEQPVRRRREINGQEVRILRFQTSLVPLRSGSIELGPASLQLSVLYNRSRSLPSLFGRFFSDSFMTTEREPRTLHSNPLTLTVLTLPEEGKPPSFSGAVGTFSMEVTAAPTQLEAGDPITVRMRVNGTERVSETQPPTLVRTEGFRTYTPQVDHPDEQMTVFEQVLIPHDDTVSEIPPVRFSYFDPQKRQYQTIESEPISLLVQPAQNAQPAAVVGATGFPTRGEEQLGQDIVYIKDEPGQFRGRATAWYRSVPFLAWHAVPLILLVAAVWYDRRRERLSGDLRYARFTRAGKAARQGLMTAEQALAHNDSSTFYEALSRTLQEYLGAKLDLPPGRIEAEAVAACGVPTDCVPRIHTVLTTCEQVRFAPGTGSGDMQQHLTAVQEIITQLERQQRFSAGETQTRAA